MIRRTVSFFDERTGGAPLARKALRYVFPDHWSFLLGEVALYAFVVLLATGVYLTLFFHPSLAHTTYHGPYAPLRGQEMSEAYRSTVDISFQVKARGLRARVAPAPVIKHEHRMWANTPEAERDRLSKRNYYRFLDRWRGRMDLTVGGGPGG